MNKFSVHIQRFPEVTQTVKLVPLCRAFQGKSSSAPFPCQEQDRSLRKVELESPTDKTHKRDPHLLIKKLGRAVSSPGIRDKGIAVLEESSQTPIWSLWVVKWPKHEG